MVVFDVRQGPFQETFYQCVTHGVYTAEWQEHLYTFFTLLFTFIIPLIILAATYLLTVCTLHRESLYFTHRTDTSCKFRIFNPLSSRSFKPCPFEQRSGEFESVN
jgi:hypothetical protein